METIKSALENIIIFITKVTVMKNKSTILIVIAAIVLGFGIYGSTSFIGSKEVKGPTEKEEKEVVTEPVTTAAEGVGEEENGESEVEIASAVKTEFPLEMAEEEIQNTIHAMSILKFTQWRNGLISNQTKKELIDYWMSLNPIRMV